MKRKKIFILIILLVLLIAGLFGGYKAYEFYNYLYKPNVKISDDNIKYLFIKTGASYADVIDSLKAHNLINDIDALEWVAKKKNYTQNIKPGRYLIKNNMSNTELVNLLRSGKQEPLKLVFNNIRTKEQLAGRIGKQIEADSASILNLLNDDNFVEQYDFNTENILLMFLPNTYELYWNTTATQFAEKMHKEYQKFWTTERLSQASAIGRTPIEIGIIASITQSETNKKDEMARVAGVYINRLKKNMRLQADPTVVFAWGDFTITRVLFKHLEIESPYNTYKYFGLPPGPITLPEPHTIDKVLNYEKHNYIFFCAKDDLTGYHAFAVTHAEHVKNAQRYQKALDRLNIKK